MNIDQEAFNSQFVHTPQQIEKNVYFGTLASFQHLNEFKNKNIRFFIGIDIGTDVMNRVYNESGITRLYDGNQNDIIMINFDTKFVVNQLYQNYILNNTKLLHEMMASLDNTNVSLLDSVLYGKKHDYLKMNSNVVAATNVEQFVVFNDIVQMFKMTNNNCFIFSEDENNDEMVALLVSLVIKKNPNLKIMDSLQFIKSLKIDDNSALREEKVFWNSGLLNYYEMIRKNSINWGLNSLVNKQQQLIQNGNTNNIQYFNTINNNNNSSATSNNSKRSNQMLHTPTTPTSNRSSMMQMKGGNGTMAQMVSKRARSD